MKVIKPPHPQEITESPSVFLAGSIEMGKAEDWQNKFDRLTLDLPGTILNPRRDSWDSSWEQSIDNPKFKEQVEWELKGLLMADYVVVYFDPETKSPVTMLELGMVGCEKNGKVLVCCPDGFFRKGNIDIFCEMFEVKQFNSLEDIVKFLRKTLTISTQSDSSFPLINQLQQEKSHGHSHSDSE